MCVGICFIYIFFFLVLEIYKINKSKKVEGLQIGIFLNWSELAQGFYNRAIPYKIILHSISS